MMRNKPRMLIATLVGMTGLLVWPGMSSAEPSPHYANAPDVLPAPMAYGREYRARESSVSYANSPAGVRYERTYTEPTVRTTRLITTTTPAGAYEEPVVYTTTYGDYEPASYVRFSYDGGYGYPYRYVVPYGDYGYAPYYGYAPTYRYGPSYGYARYYGHHRHYGRYGYAPHRSFFRHGYRGPSYSHRLHSTSRFFGRSHFGHGRSHGFSFGRSRASSGRFSRFGAGFNHGHRGFGRSAASFRRR